MKKRKTISEGSCKLPFFFFFLFILGGANSIAQSQFKLITDELGISHYHSGFIGGGVAIFDYDQDGFQDMYLTGGQSADELFKNNGTGGFIRVSNYANLGHTRFKNTMCISVGDINNDGFMDLFVGTIRNDRSLLYLNDGIGKFTEIGLQAGIIDEGWAAAATFADVNLDGFLDLYIGNYVKKEKLLRDSENNVIGFEHDCFANKLYINNGDLTFTEVSAEQGTDNSGCALAIVSSDVNQDNYPDLYIANDFGEWIEPNACLTNQYPQENFVDYSEIAGLDAAIYGMGIASGDYDRNGLPDYYVTNLGRNVLFQNQGNTTFVEQAVESGVDNTYFGDVFSTSWGTAFFDFDHDGYEDLFVANGHIPASSVTPNTLTDPNKLFKNRRDGTFEDVTDIHGMGSVKINRGMATGDIDNDGDLDLVVATLGDPDGSGVLIYENLYEGSGNWLKLKLEGVEANRDAIGAKAKLYAGGEIFYRERLGASSHASQSSEILHFGLGDFTSIDSLLIIWPGGKEAKYEGLGTNNITYIRENELSYHILGCTDPDADNFDPEATLSYGCWTEIKGCLDDESELFNFEANISDGSCESLITSLKGREVREISVNPNPIVDFSMLTYGEEYLNGTLRVIDLSGRILLEEHLKSNPHKLTRGKLKRGIYILNITNKKKAFSTRILIE